MTKKFQSGRCRQDESIKGGTRGVLHVQGQLFRQAEGFEDSARKGALSEVRLWGSNHISVGSKSRVASRVDVFQDDAREGKSTQLDRLHSSLRLGVLLTTQAQKKGIRESQDSRPSTGPRKTSKEKPRDLSRRENSDP